MTPVATDGWGYWVHPDFLDKPYLLGNRSGATISFELSTSVGVIKMYALRSRTFGLGNVLCWVGEDRHLAVKAVGWWDNDRQVQFK